MQPSTASVDGRNMSGHFTGTKNTTFSHIHSSIVPERKLTSFAVKTPLGGTPPLPNFS